MGCVLYSGVCAPLFRLEKEGEGNTRSREEGSPMAADVQIVRHYTDVHIHRYNDISNSLDRLIYRTDR